MSKLTSLYRLYYHDLAKNHCQCNLFPPSLVITFLAMVQRVYDKGISWQILSFTGGVLWVTLPVYFSKRIEKFPKEVVWKGTLLGTLFVGNFVFIAYR